jgi:hypothetical protein
MRSMNVLAAALLLGGMAGVAQAQDAARAVSGGGVSAPGWTGKIDAAEAQRGGKLEDAKLAPMGGGFHVTTGPAVAYWNPANKATGSYTVKATFAEPQYQNLNDHPHPYGVFIGGNDMGTDNQSYLYCAAYGNGSFIVRGFGPAAFQMGGRRPETNAAVNKAADKGQPVKQEIAINVTPDKVECAINGTTVASYPKADVVGAGKLKSTDGVYGIRSGHNTEVHVTGLAMTSAKVTK